MSSVINRLSGKRECSDESLETEGMQKSDVVELKGEMERRD